MTDKRNELISFEKDGEEYEVTALSTLEKSVTKRGFGLYEFVDFSGQECSLQDSSAAEESAIWFGVDVNIKGESVSTRMHLTQEQVKVLLPTLTYFAETGSYVRDFKKINMDNDYETRTDKHEKDKEYSFRLIGDINQTVVQRDLLFRYRIPVESGPFEFGYIYPYIRDCDKEKVFDLIWEKKCVGWWHYGDYYEEYKICNKDEFLKALDDEKIKI